MLAAALARLLLPDEATLLLAVSGGPDSTALLHLCAADGALRRGVTLHAATVDHRLRPESRAEAEAVRAACLPLDIPHAILDGGAPPSTRIEERARTTRYAALAGHARRVGADVIVTAHTRDDQAETVLMRLARGSGPAGLAGIRARSFRDGMALLRPLLDVEKAALVALCHENGWPFAEDPMNADPRFARARLRMLAPTLAAEGLTPGRLATLARRLAETEEALERQVTAANLTLSVAGGGYDAVGFAREPRAIRLRLLARLIETARPEPAAALRLERLERLETALTAAAAALTGFQGTLAGVLVTLHAGRLTARLAPPRRALTFSGKAQDHALGNPRQDA